MMQWGICQAHSMYQTRVLVAEVLIRKSEELNVDLTCIVEPFFLYEC